MRVTQKQYNMCAFLCQTIYTKLAFPSALRANHSIEKISGLRADIFEYREETYIVFSGTNGFLAINDWLCNTKMALGIRPRQFKQALKFVKEHINPKKRTVITGHSLGCALAMYCVNNIEHDNVMAVTFNGAGVRHLVKPKYEYNIYNYVTTKDILNRIAKWLPFKYFKHIGEVIYITDSVSRHGIESHSNWLVMCDYKVG